MMLFIVCGVGRLVEVCANMSLPFLDLYFLVEWIGEQAYDVLHSKSIHPPRGCELSNVTPGMVCTALHEGQTCDVKVIKLGMRLLSSSFTCSGNLSIGTMI